MWFFGPPPAMRCAHWGPLNGVILQTVLANHERRGPFGFLEPVSVMAWSHVDSAAWRHAVLIGYGRCYLPRGELEARLDQPAQIQPYGQGHWHHGPAPEGVWGNVEPGDAVTPLSIGGALGTCILARPTRHAQ